MYVCMYVCMYICMCMYVYMYVCVCMYVCIYVCVCMYVCILIILLASSRPSHHPVYDHLQYATASNQKLDSGKAWDEATSDLT